MSDPDRDLYVYAVARDGKRYRVYPTLQGAKAGMRQVIQDATNRDSGMYSRVTIEQFFYDKDVDGVLLDRGE